MNSTLIRKGWSGRVRVSRGKVERAFGDSIAKFDVADAFLGKSDFDTAQFMEAEE